MKHLLVTNDYPPKIGGIQSYLWEIYRRIPQDEVTVLCTPFEGSQEFDLNQTHRIIRTRQKILLPTPVLARTIRKIVQENSIDIVLFDPAVPVGILGPRIGSPYGVILHGAEVTIPGRIPILKSLLGNVLRGSKLVITAGEYSTQEAERAAGCKLPVSIVPPGVDTKRFTPLSVSERNTVRAGLRLCEDDEIVLALSRLVPRKGMDTLIKAVSILQPSRPNLKLLIAGTGRDQIRLERIATKLSAPVKFLGHVSDELIPSLYGMADVFSMLCRVRWGGLEQEGFGIVFLEAAATGVPQIAGQSGGASEAVEEMETGLIVHNPKDEKETARKLLELLEDHGKCESMGKVSRERAVKKFSYDILAKEFHQALLGVIKNTGGGSGIS
ncbi:MAG: glycosyltransferase family 4 protein [Acidimicrobiales bacterium]|nr:glycosyltransferase family 4 protein [Acidimicrobiales bacterium]|tara:strand:+ start:10069 stop:11220 length:1152 start_codon:yes stop_codon:yes gene_type:complete